MMDPDQKFMKFVAEWASARHCTFEVETFDGNESPDLIDGMAVDDVWGWLLPVGTTEKTDEHYGCIEWKNNAGHLILEWKQYDN